MGAITICLGAAEKFPNQYALGLKKVKPQNVKTCSAEYWAEVVTAIGKYNKVPKEKIEKAKKSRIYLK